MSPKAWPLFLTVLALAAGGLLGAANLYYGDLNQDEGWYLYAAGQVADGALPYRDFAFTQGPVLPLAYSLGESVVTECGVAGGRMITAGLGLLAAILAACVAVRAAPPGWGAFAFAATLVLLLVNVYHTYFTTIVKTYSLSALFLTAGFLAVSFVRKGKRGIVLACVAAVILVLASGTRLSAGLALPVTGLVLLFQRRKLGDGPWIGFGLAGAAALALVFGTFWFLAPEASRFFLLDYHTARAAGEGLLDGLIYKAGFLSRFAGGYFMPVLALLGLLLAGLFRVLPGRAPGRGGGMPGLLTLLWLTFIAVTLLHASAPFPYDDYQVMIAPLLVAAVSAGWARMLAREEEDAEDHVDEAYLRRARRKRAASWGLALLFLGSVGAIGASTIPQDWFVRGRTAIWWEMKDKPALVKLRDAADLVQKHVNPDEILLTQDTYLAVEANRAVPQGLEMGPFSYYPDLERERAETLHVMNREMLTNLFAASDAPLAAFSGYGLTIAGPGVERLAAGHTEALELALLQHYDLMTNVHWFGQALTTLSIYRKTGPPPAPEPSAADPTPPDIAPEAPSEASAGPDPEDDPQPPPTADEPENEMPPEETAVRSPRPPSSPGPTTNAPGTGSEALPPDAENTNETASAESPDPS